jgi:hypothetical protein
VTPSKYLLIIGAYLLLSSAAARAAHKATYIAGGVSSSQTAEMRRSGFDTVILWSFHVSGSGAISLNNDVMVTNAGAYVYGTSAPANVALLKQAPTSITRIEFSVGSAGAADFEGIEGLVNSTGSGGGTGANSILRRNFTTLRTTFPQVDAINFDDESNYDVPSSTAFALMLVDLGYRITFAPYTRRTTYWGPLYTAIEAARPGAVDHIYVQCYDGGAFNNPVTWNASFGSLKVEPGLWAGPATVSKRNDAPEVQTKMEAWRASANIPGGFIWRFDYMKEGGFTPQDYAAAIDGKYFASFEANKYYKIINQHSGKALAVLPQNVTGLTGSAVANGAEIAQWTYNGDDERLHWKIEDAGDGFRKITNRYSGKAMAVFPNTLDGVTALPRTDNGADIAQWDYLTDLWYQWRITSIPNGYKIINRSTGKAAAVFGANAIAGGPSGRTIDGAEVGQWEYLGDTWYDWNIIEIKPLLAPRLTMQGSTLQLDFEGEPLSTVTLQSSPRLSPGPWTTLQTSRTNAAGQLRFVLPRPTDPKRFYRGFRAPFAP